MKHKKKQKPSHIAKYSYKKPQKLYTKESVRADIERHKFSRPGLALLSRCRWW